MQDNTIGAAAPNMLPQIKQFQQKARIKKSREMRDSLTRRATELNRIPWRDRIVISERLQPWRVTLRLLLRNRNYISIGMKHKISFSGDLMFGSEGISAPLADNNSSIANPT